MNQTIFLRAWIIIFGSFIVATFLYFDVIMEVVNKGSTEMLIALVISSFTLAYLPLQLNEKYKNNINLFSISLFFILSGVLMSMGFSFPFILKLNNLILFGFVYILILTGITFFAASCITLLYVMKKLSEKVKKDRKY
jgi:hypothetical protein